MNEHDTEEPMRESRGASIDWTGDSRSINVNLESQKRFEVQVVRAEAVQRHVLRRQFDVLLVRLATWLSDQKAVERSYVLESDDAQLFVVMRSVAMYDAAFSDSLSALDLSIANDPELNLLRLDTLALPAMPDAALLSILDRSMEGRHRSLFVLKSLGFSS